MDRKEKIEIFDMSFFQTLNPEMEIVESVQKVLGNQGIGWHYFLDLAWLIKEVRGLPKGSLILDAGAGLGLAQFILLELGYNVISVDFSKHEYKKSHRNRYGKLITYLNSPEKSFSHPYAEFTDRALPKGERRSVYLRARGILSALQPRFLARRRTVGRIQGNLRRPATPDGEFRGGNLTDRDASVSCGTLYRYKADLRNLRWLPNNLVDAVVSVSALEHNEHKDVVKCMRELLRITKPGGPLMITVSASLADDWLHEPSKGWCYSEDTLKELFQLPQNVESNYSKREELFEKLGRENNELHTRLAPGYYKSDKGGMPWGKWDPQYQPVGIVKIKA